MRRWIGRWIIGVSLIHSAATIAMFWPTIRDMAQRGVWDSVGTDPMRGAVAWFFLTGLFMFVLGLNIDKFEGSTPSAVGGVTGWALLLTVIFGIVLMPVSGFWLLIPPALALCRRSMSFDAQFDSAAKPIAEVD
jgi:hypothetical protein